MGFCRDVFPGRVSKGLLSKNRRCALDTGYSPTMGFGCSGAGVHLDLACVRTYRYKLKLQNDTDCEMSFKGKVENESEISFGGKV
jgi:hypothetical protein